MSEADRTAELLGRSGFSLPEWSIIQEFQEALQEALEGAQIADSTSPMVFIRKDRLIKIRKLAGLDP